MSIQYTTTERYGLIISLHYNVIKVINSSM